MMENHLGLLYTTRLINVHCHHKVFNAVGKSTFNPDFLILQPKRKKYRELNKVHILRVIGRNQDGAK